MSRAAPQPLSGLKLSRHHLELLGLKLLSWGVPFLSRQAVGRVASIAGWLGYYLLINKRRIADANLDLAFGDARSKAEKARIARLSLQNFVYTELALFWAPRLNERTAGSIAEIDPEELAKVQQIIASGRGAIFVTAHYGDWESLGLLTPYLGVPGSIVVREMRNRRTETILARLRSRSGQSVVPRQKAIPRLLQALRRGESIALLVDLNSAHGKGGRWVNFFGLPVVASAAPAALALRTGAAIIPILAEPMPGGRVKVGFGAEIACPKGADGASQLCLVTQACMDFFESAIRDKPWLWLWSYKRWKYSRTLQCEGYPYYAKFCRP